MDIFYRSGIDWSGGQAAEQQKRFLFVNMPHRGGGESGYKNLPDIEKESNDLVTLSFLKTNF